MALMEAYAVSCPVNSVKKGYRRSALNRCGNVRFCIQSGAALAQCRCFHAHSPAKRPGRAMTEAHCSSLLQQHACSLWQRSPVEYAGWVLFAAPNFSYRCRSQEI